MRAMLSLTASARAVFFGLLIFFTWKTLTPDLNEDEPSFFVARFIASLLFGDTALTDKVLHFGGYAALSFTALFARFRIANRPWAPMALLALYGLALEGLQGLGGVRAAEWSDALANALGVLFGYAIADVVDRRLVGRA